VGARMSDDVWQEVVAIINYEFVRNGQFLTTDLLKQIISETTKVLTEQPPSD